MKLNLEITIDETINGYSEIQKLCKENNVSEHDVWETIVIEGLYAHIERNSELFVLTNQIKKQIKK